jgi:hypothetical protein
MYKAIHPQTEQEIIILSPLWLKRIAQLRAMDQADLLVCQGCRQPLRVKAGEVKRPHFAHKHLQACSFGTESAEILAARAVLYDWLFRQFGEAVDVEKELPASPLPRPVDCWVEASAGTFAYWIVESGIKLEPREAIKAAFNAPGVQFHVVFLASMLNEEKKEFQSLLLTPTERAFMKTTPFDEALAGIAEAGSSLHYLDTTAETLITYRDLRLHHRPNWYKGMKKTTRLDAMRASMLTGDPLHPGEMDRLRSFQKKQQRLEKKQQQFQQREAEWARRLSQNDQPGQQARSGWQSPPAPPERKPPPAQKEHPALPCALCGQITLDYWYAFTEESGRRLCHCRECLE